MNTAATASTAADSAQTFSGVAPPPTIFFGDAHHCFSIAYFPEGVEKIIIASALGGAETPVGFVNLSGTMRENDSPERYILLTNHRLFIRDSSELVHVLWYADLGDIHYIDRHAEKQEDAAHRLFGWLLDKERRFTLKIAATGWNRVLFSERQARMTGSRKLFITFSSK